MTMKELIPKDEFGIFADSRDTARVDSYSWRSSLNEITLMSCEKSQKSLNPHLD